MKRRYSFFIEEELIKKLKKEADEQDYPLSRYLNKILRERFLDGRNVR